MFRYPAILKPWGARRVDNHVPVATTYSRQAYRPITTIPEAGEVLDPPRRAFHWVSVISPAASKIGTGEFDRDWVTLSPADTNSDCTCIPNLETHNTRPSIHFTVPIS